MPTTLRRRLAAVLAAVLALTVVQLLTTARPASAQEAYTGYLMVHFTGEHPIGEQIYFTHSRDGLNWTELNEGAPVLLSTVGTKGVRDPALVRSPDGSRYWILATDLRIGSGTSWGNAANNGSRNLVVWESTNLTDWSAPRLLDVAGAIPGATNAWAPEAIFDPASRSYVVYWASKAPLNGVTKHRIYAARTTDFRSVSTPAVYIDRPGGQEIIDTQILDVPERTGGYRYYRASADGQITVEGSNSIMTGWTRIGDLRHLGITNGATAGNNVEGPIWMRFNGRAQWALWLDQFIAKRGYMPVITSNPNPTTNFTQGSGYSMGVTTKRHGGILNLTSTEDARVLAKWGESRPVQRLQSVSSPDRYVRHSRFDAKVEATSSLDSQFRIVPGRTGATGTVSIQSVNYPGYFLRHRGFDFVLAPDDGSALFRADSTFTQVNGLAGTGVSFRSVNYPDRYIRDAASFLRLDPVTDQAGRAAASFRLVN